MGRLGGVGAGVLLIALGAAVYARARRLRAGGGGRAREPLPQFVLASVLAHVGLLFVLDLVLISIPVVEANREVIEAVLSRTFAIVATSEGQERRWSAVAEGPAPEAKSPVPSAAAIAPGDL